MIKIKRGIYCLTAVRLLATVLLTAPIVCLAADGASNNAATPGPGGTNVTQRWNGRGTPNSNDVFYTLGPDSKPRDGVPHGKFTEAKVIPSNVFPGTQHTYWVYV